MSYQVLARKWRPQLFEDVVGQEPVTRTLQNAIASSRIAHAFLFSGVRGVGKTTTARILAKALNCEKGPTVTPCGECVSCREITSANSVDVMEIDAASNTGVDNIRELRESARYGTARDRFKIFIIDEVHMLSNAAFNALLKTLEEPPPHVKFVLATTEAQKIPVTITSRCQHFDFKPISFPLILERLRMVCGEEGLQISDYALRAIVATAQGSMRDAQSALDQIIAFSGKEIQDQDVQVLLGVVDDQTVIDLIDTILEHDSKGLIQKVQDLADSGVDPQSFCRKLVQHVRNLMICRVTGWDTKLLNLSDSQKDAILKQAEKFTELDLIRVYDVLSRADNELRWHSHPYVHLEMTLMKLVELARLPTIEQVISELRAGPQPSAAEGSAKLFDAASDKPSPAAVSQDSQPPSPAGEPEKEETALPLVSQLFSAVQAESISLYSSMQHASETSLDSKQLTVVFPDNEKIHCQVVQGADNRERLTQIATKITGQRPRIEIKLEDSPPPAQADPIEDPKVKTFIETFPGKLVVEREIDD